MSIDLKNARSAAKRSVSITLRKLNGLLQMGAEEDELKRQVELVEKSYDELLAAHYEYTESYEGEEDQEVYLQNSTDEYYKAIGMYKNVLKANKEIEEKKEANILRQTSERDFLKLRSSLERIHNDKLEAKKLSVLEEDKAIMENNLQTLIDNLSKLSLSEDVSEKNKEADVLIIQCEKVRREINISIRELREDDSLSARSGIQGKSNNLDEMESLYGGDSKLEHLQQRVNTEKEDHWVNEEVKNAAHFGLGAGGNDSYSGLSVNASKFTPTFSTSQFKPVDSLSQIYQTHPSSSQKQQSQPSLPQMHHINPSSSQNQQSQPSLSQIHHTHPNLSQFQQIHPNSSQFQQTQPSLSQIHHINPSLSQVQSTQPVMGNTVAQSSPIRTKKPSLPMFSGNRTDWLEFKCLWRSLAEAQLTNKMHLAMELKRCCSKGRAAERLKHILVTSEKAYDDMWDRLKEEYDDPGLCVQSALNRLMMLKGVEDKDYAGMVRFVDHVEGVFNQLKEFAHLDSVHMVDVDRVSSLLPKEINMSWQRKYRELPSEIKLKPFTEFVNFLKIERSVVARLDEVTPSMKKQMRKSHSTESHGTQVNKGSVKTKSNSNSVCIVHGLGHTTVQCKVFKGMDLKQKYNVLRKKNLCFKCFGKHSRRECIASSCRCGQDHHFLLCTQQGKGDSSQSNSDSHLTSVKSTEDGSSSATSHTCYSESSQAFYPVHIVHLNGNKTPVTVFMDGGSNASYVTEACAKKYRLKKLNNVSLNINTVGGNRKEHSSSLYEIPLVTQEKKVVTVKAYSLPKITNPAPPVSRKDLEYLFPQFEVSSLVRPSSDIDILLGSDWFGLHPKKEIAKCGDNLSVMKGSLGVCLVGSHPHLHNSSFEETNLSFVESVDTHLILSHPALAQPYSFIVGEDLGTESTPRCGNCKCGKCPLPGHSLSFREEQELHLIRSNLEYDKVNQVWVTSYPWLVDPFTLPDNFSAAFATLKNTEKRIKKDPEWAQSYGEQIVDMLERGVARKLTKTEMNEWQGPVFYISHLAVINEKSKSTPVRIVFNSSQVHQGKSLNSCLAKGPDSYRNSSLGILLRWREESVALVGDIRKMFHSVYLKSAEQHCHRFLWRDLDESKIPNVYIMERVNMGDRPAPAIATEALMLTAESFSDLYPKAARFVQESSYVDDMADSVESDIKARELAQETELLLAKGNFSVKEWQFSGSGKSKTVALKGDGNYIGVLGTQWNPVNDTISFQVTINFSKKKRGLRIQPNIKREEIDTNIPEVLTKRLVLQQVMSIYDPMGLASPFTLLGKIYLRETWLLGLDWDDPIPPSLHQKWVKFFKSLFQLEDLSFPRCMKPENAVGNPWLVLLSDGSDIAYGCAAYVRWQCLDGSVAVRLMMSKSRIAPINKVSTPRMELNGAVISKRCRAAIHKESRYKFDKIIHLLDSETVLNQLNKVSTRFNPYEGVRIGEIQASCNGDMSEWAWMAGKKNTSDWLTRGRTPDQLNADSEWFQGPPMLYLPFEEWDIKFGKTSDENVPGEKKLHGFQTLVTVREVSHNLLTYENMSSMSKAVGVTARLISIARKKSFKGGRLINLNPSLRIEAEKFLVLEAQGTLDMESNNYRKLNPAQREDGVWVVGASRLAENNPMSGIHVNLPIFLPLGHGLARLAMKAAHERGHRGRDATLAGFREKFWTPSGCKLAKTIVNKCQYCRLRNASLIQQEMGRLPIERTTPSPPFNFSMLDLFGPYRVRGEVQRRVSGKVWGVLFTDMVSRAVHIEVMSGYDTGSFMLALRRFVSVRGWPQKLFSDPGSQLVGAKRELKEAMCGIGSENGLEWIVGTPDAPWQQGAVESLVKSVKKALDISVHNQRLSVTEFLTVCSEAANLVNERPLGMVPSLDSNINILTPNCLLLGRASSVNPNAWQTELFSLKDRNHLVSSVTDQFWRHWLELFAPTLVYRHKWHEKQRDLKVGDVVLVLDSDTFKGKYKLAVVTGVLPSRDGRVRKVTVSYKNFRTGEKVHVYKGQMYTSVQRSCQRLVLLVPVDE